MTDLKADVSSFVTPGVLPPSMLNHAVLRSLMGTDWEHHGILQKLQELEEYSMPLDDPLVGMVLSASEFVNFAFWSDESNFSEAAVSLIRGEKTYDRIIKDGWWNRAWTWLQDFDQEFEETSAPGKRIAGTGLRKSELLRLEVGHVNFGNASKFCAVNGRDVEIPPNWLLVVKSKNRSLGPFR